MPRVVAARPVGPAWPGPRGAFVEGPREATVEAPSRYAPGGGAGREFRRCLSLAPKDTSVLAPGVLDLRYLRVLRLLRVFRLLRSRRVAESFAMLARVIESKRVEIKATEEVAVKSEQEIKVEGEGDVKVVGKTIHLN